jgi:hypothetical protein
MKGELKKMVKGKSVSLTNPSNKTKNKEQPFASNESKPSTLTVNVTKETD